MIADREIVQRLDAVIDRVGLSPDQQRLARRVMHILVPEMKKILQEEAASQKKKGET